MRILGVIPARGGSKGVPGKNARVVGGLPFIAHSVRTGLQLADVLYRTVVSTDDPELADLAKQAGGDVPFLRPDHLAEDSTPMLPVVQHAVSHVEREDDVVVDWVLLLQPTNPIRDREDIEGAIALAAAGECDSVISVVRVFDVHPVLMKRIEGGYLQPFSVPEPEGTRRQDYQPAAYMRNGAIYLTRRDVLMSQGSIWGERIRPFEMPPERSVGIDSELDVRLVDLLLADRNGPGSGAG